MSRCARRALLVHSPLLLASALAWAWIAAHPGVAGAQSRRYPPAPVDVDQGERARSELWERVLHPERERYQRQVAAARFLLDDTGGRDEARALEHLDSAVALAPGRPEAHWLRAVASERLQRWDVCAEAYGRVFALEPAYEPELLPGGRKARWALDFGLALCRARSGDYEGGVAHLRRILGRGLTGEAQVYLHLGESYMALGRLAEARDILELASRQHPGNARIEYALAAAYDRSQMPDRSRQHLRAARRHNRSLALLEAPDQIFIPAEEALYYLGLAYEDAGNTDRALIYFRHYLHAHAAGPWQRATRQRARRLAAAPRTSGAIEISDTDVMDREAVALALERVDAELQACVRALPSALLHVRVTVLLGSGSGGRERARGAAGVKAQVVHSFATEAEAQAQAQRCLESVAGRISLPLPRGRAGGYVTVSFPVIAR